MSRVVEWPEEAPQGNLQLLRKLCSAFATCPVDFEDDPDATSRVFPRKDLRKLLEDFKMRVRRQPHVLEIDMQDCGSPLAIIGDIHGQYHDFCKMMHLPGMPLSGGRNTDRYRKFIFNGDFVDRGTMGTEVVILLLATVVVFPERVFLLRGNHETRYAHQVYGFSCEFLDKYGRKLYNMLMDVMRNLPVACIVNDEAVVMHGGLFRALSLEEEVSKGEEMVLCKIQKEVGFNEEDDSWMDVQVELGTLKDLNALPTRCYKDPPERHMLEDILWSDPSMQKGLCVNPARGVGLRWGPDMSEQFMQENAVSLIVRSHEGPDARKKPGKEDMKSIARGFTIDHDLEHTGGCGRVVTVFSAPNYPQGPSSCGNAGAVLTIRWHKLPTCDEDCLTHPLRQESPGVTMLRDIKRDPTPPLAAPQRRPLRGVAAIHRSARCGSVVSELPSMTHGLHWESNPVSARGKGFFSAEVMEFSMADRPR